MIAKELTLWALRKRRPWRVRGTSMSPSYLDGDLVLIDPEARVEAGQAVIARHPFKNLDVLKYVQSVDDDGYLRLRSPSGDDSRQFGRVAVHTVRGSVALNISGLRRRR